MLSLAGCLSSMDSTREKFVPAESFSETVRQGRMGESLHAKVTPVANNTMLMRTGGGGDPRFEEKGFELKRSMNAASPNYNLPPDYQASRPQVPPAPERRVQPGSSAPYYRGQMTQNPSLWPDEGQRASLFRDFRAVQAMDLLTIVINEQNEGLKRANTIIRGEFDLLAGITEFFGLETSKWAANNVSLDPTALIQAQTDTEFRGEGDTNRRGILTGRISAVVLEVLPNGVLRIEGTKIVTINNEEEIMVITGLVRPFDVTSQNEVQSGQIANMRVDFYGKGVVSDQQTPGWGARLFEFIWPF